MKKLLSLLFAAAIILTIPAHIFAVDTTPNFNRLPNPDNTNDTTTGTTTTTDSTTATTTQKYGADGSETEDCTKAMEEYKGYYYIITDYNLNIDVAENNTYKIHEDYDVCYNTSGKHGIYRDIPTSGNMWRENGDITKNVKMQVSNISVKGDDYTRSREGSNIRLQIGNANRTLARGTSKHYEISYDYNFGPDRLNGVDEFYFNLIGSEWASDVVFLNTDFTINFPKNIDENKIGFTHGYTHDSLSGGTTFELLNNKTITGHYASQLKGGEALTIRVTLPDGYVQNAAYDTNIDRIIPIAVMSLVLVILLGLGFLIFGTDTKLPLYTRNDPPEGINPVQFGALVGSNNSSCVMSLLYHLGEKGYLRIEDSGKKHYGIVLLKDYDGDDPAERTFLRHLQSYNMGHNGYISVSSLEDSFYTKIPSIIKAANIKELENKIYTKSGNAYRAVAIISTVFYVLASLLIMAMDDTLPENWPAALMIIGFFMLPGLIMVIMGLKKIIKKQEIVNGIFLIGFGIIFGGIPGIAIQSFFDQMETYHLAEIIIIFATTAAMILFAKNGRRYTEEGRRIMTDVLSYYETIKHVEPDSEHGFSYFYYTFAFAFAAGLSTAFSKKFKNAISQPPDWYSSSTGDFSSFDAGSFASSMNSISSTSTSSPSSDSSGSGGSSGGGSSGGGGGGGGGGGW